MYALKACTRENLTYLVTLNRIYHTFLLSLMRARFALNKFTTKADMNL